MTKEFPIGQGHGIEGRYGGLTDEYADLRTAKVVILPVPFDLTTTYQHGAQKGPAALIEASRNLELYDIETNSSVYKVGIHTAEGIRPIHQRKCSKSSPQDSRIPCQRKISCNLGRRTLHLLRPDQSACRKVSRPDRPANRCPC